MQRMMDHLRESLSPNSRIYTEASRLDVYSFDQGEVPASLRKLLMADTRPDVVVQPGSLEDLQSIVRIGRERDVAIVPRGASTFGMGGAVPHQGGILLDFSPRREIYEWNAAEGLIRVGAGCRWADVSQYLQPLGYELLCYPTSWFSTVGGWVSTGGVGIGCSRYGSFHDWIHSITVVTAAGEKKLLTRKDPELKYFLGTEGQMGAIWDVSFRVRRKAGAGGPFLVLLEDNETAFSVAQTILRQRHPYHLKFLDAARIQEINHLWREEHPGFSHKTDLPEKPTLLVFFDSPQEGAEFCSWGAGEKLNVMRDYRAHRLWRERMFPLRVKRVAPGLLASETILPISRLGGYVKRAHELGHQFCVNLAVECYFLPDETALTLPVYTFSGRGRVDESAKAALAFVLTQTAIRMGGRPYGIGLWNSPFLKARYNGTLGDLSYYKNSIDPGRNWNRGKFFELEFSRKRTPWIGRLAAFPLRSSLIPYWTRLLTLLAPLVTQKGKGKRPEDEILLNEELCSRCGSCIPVCPAYVDTEDERTTARGKLYLGKKWIQGGFLTPEEASVLFLCMHCGACTDVCQSRLDLVPVWDELERRIENHFGKDRAHIKNFMESVERKKIMGVPYARGFKVLAGSKSE